MKGSPLLNAELEDLNDCIETWESMLAFADDISDEPEKDKKEFRRMLRYLKSYRAMLTKAEGQGGDPMFHQH